MDRLGARAQLAQVVEHLIAAVLEVLGVRPAGHCGQGHEVHVLPGVGASVNLQGCRTVAEHEVTGGGFVEGAHQQGAGHAELFELVVVAVRSHAPFVEGAEHQVDD